MAINLAVRTFKKKNPQTGELQSVSAIPEPFGKERAEELKKLALERVNTSPAKGMVHYTSFLDGVMTDGELAYVYAIWDSLPGNTSWSSAWNRILTGKVK